MLALGGETRLAITRVVPGQVYTMVLLERSVRMIEDFMGVPLPEQRYGADSVDLRFVSDVENCDGFQGQFRWTHMVNCMDENAHSRANLLRVIARETAGYYWNSRQHHPRWLEEGAAGFLEYIVQGDLSPDFDRRAPCTLADNVVEFLQVAPPQTQDIEDDYRQAYRDCEYGLGGRMFHALYHGTDDAAFRAAFHDFYQRLQRSPSASIRDALRDAFAAHTTPDQLAAVDRILEERYGPSPH